MQDAIAILIAVVAAGFLARRAWLRFAARRSGCGACSSCPSADSTKSATLVNISPVVSRPALGRNDLRK
jgi:hypothetical protein